MQRREFINWVGLGLIASYIPVALVACTENDTVASDASDASDVSETEALPVGTVAALEEAGYLLNEESKVMVVKNSDGKLMAVNPTCTHQGCTVDWESDEAKFVCPCHNAKYAPNGKVLAKPAPSDLSTYEVKEENGEILVKLT